MSHDGQHDPRQSLGADPRRFTVDAEDRARLEALAARTGAVIETEPEPAGITVRHIAANGRITSVTGATAPDAVRLLVYAVAHLGEPIAGPDAPKPETD